MSQTRILIVAILTVLMTFVYASNAQDRPEGDPPVMGPRPERPMGPEAPGPWMREYAEELRLRAREAQEFAERLRQDADRFEQMARQGGRRETEPGPLEPMRRELAEIKEAIGRAEREGRPDEAAELRRNAERLTDEMQARQRELRQGGRREAEPGPLEPMRRELAEIKEAIGRAEREGRPDEAAELRKNAERLMGEMRARQQESRQGGGPEVGPGPMEPIRRELAELREAIGRAEREGRQDEAAELRRNAERLTNEMRARQRESRQGGRPGVMPRSVEPMRGELAEIKEAIGRAEREGRPDEAAELREKAERLTNEMRARQQRPQGDEQRFAEAKERIEQLKNQLREAEESGRPEQAQELRGQIQGIEMKMRRGMESRDMGAQIEAMRGKVAELRKQSQRAKGEGRFDEAQAQWEKANDTERQIGEMEQKMARPQKEPQARRRVAQNQGVEKAPRERGREPSPDVEQLREKVARLQEEVARLNQQLRDKEPR